MAIRNDISIDWSQSPRQISVNAPSIEITVQDLLDTLRYEESRPANIDKTSIVDASGKEPLEGGVYVGLTVALQNAQLGFAPRPGPSWVQCSISGGNLVAFDANGAGIASTFATAYVSISKTSSASATLQELGSIQYSSFNGGVTVDVVNGVVGTEFPIGTPEQPVNNISDAHTISVNRGFNTIYVLGNLTLIESMAGYIFIGQNPILTTVTIADQANVTNCEFRNMAVEGVLDGGNLLKDCVIHDLDYVNGMIESSAIAGVITIAGNISLFMYDCWSASSYYHSGPAPPDPIIDMGGEGQVVGVRNFSGTFTLRNITGVNSRASIDMLSGTITLDPTCTGGIILVRGNAYLVNTANGATVVDQTTPSLFSNLWTYPLEAGYSPAQLVTLIAAGVLGLMSGAGPESGDRQVAFRDLANTKDRIIATVDQYGNRKSVTLDPD